VQGIEKKIAARKTDSHRKNEGFGQNMFHFSPICGQSPFQSQDYRLPVAGLWSFMGNGESPLGGATFCLAVLLTGGAYKGRFTLSKD
jgi:hypothetical protein